MSNPVEALPERTVSPEVYEQFEEFKTKSSEPIFNSPIALTFWPIAALSRLPGRLYRLFATARARHSH